MKFQQWKQLTKVLLLGGVLLCVAAQFLPWSEISVPISGGISFYCGGLFFSISSATEEVFQLHLTPTSLSEIPSIPQLVEYYFGTIFLYFILPLSIFAILFGFVTFRRFDLLWWKGAFYSGVLSFFAVIFFVLFSLFGILQILGPLSSLYHFSYGFYLMIVGMVLFFICLVLIRVKLVGSENKDSSDGANSVDVVTSK